MSDLQPVTPPLLERVVKKCLGKDPDNRWQVEGPYVPQSDPGAGYDVSPDGQRFLMLKEKQREPAKQIQVVLNWSEELKRRVPAGKK